MCPQVWPSLCKRVGITYLAFGFGGVEEMSKAEIQRLVYGLLIRLL